MPNLRYPVRNAGFFVRESGPKSQPRTTCRGSTLVQMRALNTLDHKDIPFRSNDRNNAGKALTFSYAMYDSNGTNKRYEDTAKRISFSHQLLYEPL